MIASVGLLLAVAAGPAGAEAAGAQARAEPPTPAPGQFVDLIFTVESPELLEVSLQEQVRCEVTDPLDRVQDVCNRAAPLVDVRLVGAANREYVFRFVAPPLLGNYSVHFHMESLLTLLPAEYRADAAFAVSAPANATRPGGPGGDGGDGGDGDGPPGQEPGGRQPGGPHDPSRGGPFGPSGPIAPADAARWFVTSTLGLGVLATAYVGRRWGLGVGP